MDKKQIIKIVITDFVIMVLGVLCCLLPMLWRILVTVLLGIISILLKVYVNINKAGIGKTKQVGQAAASAAAAADKAGMGKTSTAKGTVVQGAKSTSKTPVNKQRQQSEPAAKKKAVKK